jgi:hypothetical protein
MLTFTFEENEYMKNTELTKKIVTKGESDIERAEGTEIEWKAGKDLTKKK